MEEGGIEPVQCSAWTLDKRYLLGMEWLYGDYEGDDDGDEYDD